MARRAKSRTALHYRVAIAARQTTVATLRPGKARPRVPEAYDRLGPDVTPESILPGKIALLRPDAAPNESRANEVPARLDTIFPLADEFGLESNDAGETIIRYPHGFLTEPAPAGVNSFQCEIALDPEVQTGPVSLEVFSGEKRFSAGTISHGARVLLSVRPVPGERIAVLTQWVSNGTPQRVVVRRPTFCLGDAELTHGN